MRIKEAAGTMESGAQLGSSQHNIDFSARRMFMRFQYF